MPHYDKADEQTIALINEILNEYHPELASAEVTIEAMMAYDDKGGFPVKHGGYPALAVIKISSLKNRVKGFADAEITIDAENFKSMSEPQRRALIDHELTHLVVATDKEGVIKTDDCNRPKLKIRKHDYQMGWFTEIAKRHGSNSPEVYQASMLWQKDGRTFFPTV